MFSDTHFHLPKTAEWAEDFTVTQFFKTLCANGCFFCLDIGTDHDDLPQRLSFVKQNEESLEPDEKIKLQNLLHFSAGLWPSPESIVNREAYVEEIKRNTAEFRKQNEYSLVAIGECGLDHHWNPTGVDGRCESDFDQKMFDGERELFLMQLALAKETNLPIIVHSRDAYEGTYDCIREAGYNNGIIHCYSYGLEEAKKFLDLGYYISFSGSITYTKKSKMEEMTALLNYVPKDRILMETDAPYLAPVPCRGKPNNPLLVEHTYRFAAEKLGISAEELCSIVDENCRNLFKVK